VVVLLTGTTQGTKGRITCLKRKSARVQKAQQEDTGEKRNCIILAKGIPFIRKISILYPEETQPCPQELLLLCAGNIGTLGRPNDIPVLNGCVNTID